MKRSLTSFLGQELTRSQMKSLKGGCYVCSQGGPSPHPVYGKSGTCSGKLSPGTANKLMSQLSGKGDGYNYYTVGCYGY